jgi:hypothetical protein
MQHTPVLQQLHGERVHVAEGYVGQFPVGGNRVKWGRRQTSPRWLSLLISIQRNHRIELYVSSRDTKYSISWMALTPDLALSHMFYLHALDRDNSICSLFGDMRLLWMLPSMHSSGCIASFSPMCWAHSWDNWAIWLIYDESIRLGLQQIAIPYALPATLRLNRAAEKEWAQ